MSCPDGVDAGEPPISPPILLEDAGVVGPAQPI